MAKNKKKTAGPAWASASGSTKHKSPKLPSTPFDRACAGLTAAMERVVRASMSGCYGDGPELALDLGPREPRPPTPSDVPAESPEPVSTAFAGVIPVAGPARVVARCLADTENGFWAITAAVGPYAALLSRTWFDLLAVDTQIDLPTLPHTLYLTASIVTPQEVPPEIRRTQPHNTLRLDGREHFVLASKIEPQRRSVRASPSELDVLTSIADLLARAGESEGFEVLAQDDPSGEMTRLAFVDDGAGGVGVEWGSVARPQAVDENDEDDADFDDDFGDGDEGECLPSSRWQQVDLDVIEERIDQATRLELSEDLDEAEEPRLATVVLVESPADDPPADELDQGLQLHERFVAILDTSTLEHFCIEPLEQRTLPGAVRRILDFFEEHQGGCLPHQILLEDYELDEALSELLVRHRELADLPAVDLRYTGAGDAASRFVKAMIAHGTFLEMELRERELPSRTPREAVDIAVARDLSLLGAAEAFIEFRTPHAPAALDHDFASFLLPADTVESELRREHLELDDPFYEGGELAYRVLTALDGHPGPDDRGDRSQPGGGWLPEALARDVVHPSVVDPLRALLATAPDLYLVRAKDEGIATLESLTTGDEVSMPKMSSTPTPTPIPELGEVVPLRRWRFGVTGMWLPAGKPISLTDAEALLAQIRARFGSTDADVMRSAAATILRETFVLASPDLGGG